ncbi:MAG: prolyl oligopeptidase family serine peptidase [Ignavibacteriae bacterium]|nr:prolyl oligopeptidase family serine peptidase [Ignavibacteriota bacterium]
MMNIKGLLFLILLFAGYTFSQSYKENYFEISRNNFNFKLRDGVILDCTSFTPDAPGPNGGFPCIVYCHGYGKSKDDNLSNAISFAKSGFVTYTFSMRGQGNSGGVSNLISRTEAKDLMEFIDYIKSNELIDRNRIAISGSSQGGIIPLMAHAMGLEIQCLITDLISPDFASNWIDNGCVKMSLLWTLSYGDNNARYSDEVKNYRKWILSKKRDKWDSLAFYLPQNRDFSKLISKCTRPVYISNSFQDKFFNSNSIIKNIFKFPYGSKFYFGAIEGHGTVSTEDENKYHDKSMFEWIDYRLNKAEPEENNSCVICFSIYPVINSSWSFQRIYSQPTIFDKPNRIKLYFHPSEKVSETPYSGKTASFIFKNTVSDTSISMIESVNTEFNGESFWKKFTKTNIIFESEPLEWNYNALGIPKVHLVYKSDRKVCQYNFQIYEIHKDGTTKLISSINFTDRNSSGKTKADIEGDALGHIFTAGSKIRIILTNLDTRENDNFLRTNPYVLPVLIPSSNTIYVGGTEGSYLELPLKE